MSKILVQDRITISRNNAEKWLNKWKEDYLPKAEQRGLKLTGIWYGHAEEEQAIDIFIQLELAGIAEFWMMRGAAGFDPSIAQWWQDADQSVISRERRILTNAEGGIL